MTGSNGRLGRALDDAFTRRGAEVAKWPRTAFDLDAAEAAEHLLSRERPAMVIHSAAWTDVDGCARDPGLAMRRNADAVGELARAAATRGIRLVLVSTNEVFDGRRTDGRGYVESDEPNPINPYGASKLAGEQQAVEAFAAAGAPEHLWIVRTAWLYGPPGNDFPAKIVAAASRLAAGEPLSVVQDEVGSPTYTIDLASAIADLIENAPGGTYHLGAPDAGSRFEVAGAVLRHCHPDVAVKPIGRAQFQRASTPPAWAVLDSSRAAEYGVRLRSWRAALEDYLAAVC